MKLAVSIFCESTRDALLYYSAFERLSDWGGTATFLTTITKLWNILNVRTTTKGIQKQDNTMDPVKSSVDFKLQFLKDFAEFLQRW